MASGENLGSSDSGLAWGQGARVPGFPQDTWVPSCQGLQPVHGAGGAELDCGGGGGGPGWGKGGGSCYLFTP